MYVMGLQCLVFDYFDVFTILHLHIEACQIFEIYLDPKSVTEISKEQFVAIQSLWSDPAVIKTYERRREFHLSDLAK